LYLCWVHTHGLSLHPGVMWFFGPIIGSMVFFDPLIEPGYTLYNWEFSNVWPLTIPTSRS
jgi:hypothetical protein